ncbi:MAG: transposase [Waterburya sp.]
MTCPKCQGDRIVKNGSNCKGNQQYLCKECQTSFTGNKIGRPTVGDHPLTNAEKQARFRRKKEIKYVIIDPKKRLLESKILTKECFVAVVVASSRKSALANYQGKQTILYSALSKKEKQCVDQLY